MHNIKLNTSDGEAINLPFPEDLSEVSLSNKIAFDVCKEDVLIWIKESLDDDTFLENRTYYLYLLAKAVSELIEMPLYEILKLNAKDLIDEDGELLPNVLQQHFDLLQTEDKFVFDFESADSTLTTLFHLGCNLQKDYKFVNKDKTSFKFRWKGRTWCIPHVVQRLFTGKKVYSHFSVAQAVETLQIKKYLTTKSAEKKRIVGDTDELMSVRYTAFLKMMGIALREEGKDYPLDDVAFQQEMQKRIKIFDGIDAKTAYDVTFFLTACTMS